MLWIAGIALVLAVFRSRGGLFYLGPVIAFVATTVLTYGLVRKVNRELIASRREAPTRLERAIEIGRLSVCGLGVFLLTLMICVMLVFLVFAVADAIQAHSR